jgi:hypothetical protein
VLQAGAGDQQEQASHAVEGRRQRRGLAQVADDALSRFREAGRTCRVAHQDAQGRAQRVQFADQLADQLAADVPGGTGDQ